MQTHLTVQEYASLHKVSGSRVRHWLMENRIPGAIKFGVRTWMIPVKAKRPVKRPPGRHPATLDK